MNRCSLAIRTRSLWAFLIVCTLQSLAVAHADVTFGSDCNIAIRGEITEADAAKISSSDCMNPNIHLVDSPGGDVRAAIEIGRWARTRGAATGVFFGSCHSSCALIYISGVRRMNHGVIGLHRPYMTGQPLDDRAVREAASTMLADVRRYVADMGVTPAFSDLMINTPPNDMRLFVGDEILPLVPINDPIYDEVEVAKAARRFGVDVEELRRRTVEANRACAEPGSALDESELAGAYRRHFECRHAIFWGLDRSTYLRRQQLARELCTTDSAAASQSERCTREVMRGRRRQ